MNRPRLELALLLTCLGSLTASACDSDVDAQVALAGMSGACRINSDCAELLVCVFERCHQECDTSRDCKGDGRCVKTEQTRNACQLPDEQACSEQGICPGAQVCGVDAECRDGCANDDDCVTNQVCSAGTCADTEELGAEGRLAPAAERPTAAALPCQLDSDCPDSLVCVAASCKAECETVRDCAPGATCEDGRCRQQAPPQAGCVRPSDCPEGQRCVAGLCAAEPPAPECSYDSDCPRPGHHCELGTCTCECSSDGDCGYATACIDGCACEAIGKLVGDVTITNGAELRQLDNVVQIDGALTLSLASSEIFHLPRLKKATSITLAYTANTTAVYVFDALEEVTLTLSSKQNFVAPRLWKAGSIFMSSATARDLSLPALETTENLQVQANPQITHLRFERLHTATNFTIWGNVSLVSLAAPLLATVNTMELKSNGKLQAVSLPRANPAISLAVRSSNALELLDLPAMEAPSAELALVGLPKLTSVKLDRLSSVGSLLIDGTGLTSLDAFTFATLKSAASLNFVANAALPACDLTKLDLELKAASWTGDFTQTGNLECP